MSYSFKTTYFDEPIVPGRVLDIFEPDQITRDVAVFMTHGGGWSGGSRDGYHKIMRAFNREGFICASTDYRLKPSGANILDQIEDVRCGYKLFLERLRHLGRPSKVFTFGSSAGAHLTALLSLALPGECGESTDFRPNVEWVRPVGTALQSTPVTFEPWEDIFPHIWTAMRGIVGKPYEEAPERYRNVSPEKYISDKSCPVFFMEAENEHMFPYNLVMEAVEKLKKASVRVDVKTYSNAEHGFFYDLTRRQQKEAFQDILEFIENL